MTEHIDTLISRAHLFTMQGDGVGYVADGAIAIQAGKIVAVGPTAELQNQVEATKIIDATDCAMLPGLVDGHMHTTLSLLRGVAQDAANWMQQALAPYSRHLNDEDAAAATRLNAVEALKAGTTTLRIAFIIM